VVLKPVIPTVSKTRTGKTWFIEKGKLMIIFNFVWSCPDLIAGPGD
jgi:hypothetical protein